MTSLEELRTQLSDVDDQITDLYEKRMKICEDLGICKIKNGYKTFDRQREKNKITEVMGKVSSDFNKKGIGEVYELLLAISRKLQYKQLVEAGALGRLPFIGIDSLDKDTARVVFQGTEGAYSQAAMEHYFGKGNPHDETGWDVYEQYCKIINNLFAGFSYGKQKLCQDEIVVKKELEKLKYKTNIIDIEFDAFDEKALETEVKKYREP